MNSSQHLFADHALRIANERLNEYRTESASNRLAASAKAKSPRLAGTRAALASLRTAFTGIDPDTIAVPPVRNYPYTG